MRTAGPVAPRLRCPGGPPSPARRRPGRGQHATESWNAPMPQDPAQRTRSPSGTVPPAAGRSASPLPDRPHHRGRGRSRQAARQERQRHVTTAAAASVAETASSPHSKPVSKASVVGAASDCRPGATDGGSCSASCRWPGPICAPGPSGEVRAWRYPAVSTTETTTTPTAPPSIRAAARTPVASPAPSDGTDRETTMPTQELRIPAPEPKMRNAVSCARPGPVRNRADSMHVPPTTAAAPTAAVRRAPQRDNMRLLAAAARSSASAAGVISRPARNGAAPADRCKYMA